MALKRSWIAGFFDGEGSCFVVIKKGSGGAGVHTWRIQPTVTIRQSNKEILSRIKDELGIGGITEGKSGFSNKKTHSLDIRSRSDIKAFIDAIGEEAVLRKKQLELMKELIGLKEDRGPWRGNQLLRAVNLAREIVSMNPKVKQRTLRKIDKMIKHAKKFVKEKGNAIASRMNETWFKPKSIDTELARELHYKGYSVRVIAKLINAHRSTVVKRLRERRIQIRKRGWLRFGWRDLLDEAP